MTEEIGIAARNCSISKCIDAYKEARHNLVKWARSLVSGLTA